MSGGAGSEFHGGVSRLCSRSQHCSVWRDEEGVRVQQTPGWVMLHIGAGKSKAEGVRVGAAGA